jgi:hypothetical protein
MRQPVYLRLRPFLRRDLRARLVSALVTVLVLAGLAHLGVSALSKIDSREAHQLRVDLGMEGPWAVCNGPDQPACSYEDREQSRVDARFAYERRLRLAVLDELARRVELGQSRLDEAADILEGSKVSKTGGLQGDTVGLRRALSQAVVDLRPAPVAPSEERRARLLLPVDAAPAEVRDCSRLDFDGIGWVGCENGRGIARFDQRRAVLEAIAGERRTLDDLAGRIARLERRDEHDGTAATAGESRVELVTDVIPHGEMHDDWGARMSVASWLAVRAGADAMDGWNLDNPASDLRTLAGDAGLDGVGDDLASLARAHVADLSEAIGNPGDEVWHGAWTIEGAELVAIVKPTERYRSPVTPTQQWRLFGTMLLALGGVLLVLVGPVVTATSTAREREAGTLPVLRMTGLSAGDLAMAMAIGPNVFALVAGFGLLAVALPILTVTAPVALVAEAIGVLLLLAACTHLTAIGLGDALGQRVNAMIVGGLLGLGILVPGAVGTVMVVGDMAATGFLLGPIPAVVGKAVAASGLPVSRLAVASGEPAQIVAYGLAIQALLGLLCLFSWRRRVEQPWAPLFRPLEGTMLALASVGCSAVALLDLSQRINVQTYDHVNLITFVATGFLMPVLGWLLVSSLVRPARAAAVASCSEVRFGFLRFQAFVILTGAALAVAYSTVLQRTGLGREQSEIMWATISQGVLIAETAAATLLLASRKRDGKHRVLVLGALVVLLQTVLAAAVYNLEVEHVALTQSSGHPLLVGMDASPYWLAFLVVLWAAGLGLVLAALLRERDRKAAASEESTDVEDDDEDGEGEGRDRRWVH